MQVPGPIKRIFLSYDKRDQDWAEWIWWHLEDGGHPTLRCWELEPGSNREIVWNTAFEQTEHILALFSQAYLERLNEQPAWSPALAMDPGGQQGRLIPVRIQECELPGIFNSITAIDLFDLAEDDALEMLLRGLAGKRPRPSRSPVFPGKVQQALSKISPPFPGNPQPFVEVPYQRNPWFTERDNLLEHLYHRYTADITEFLTPLALCGISGSGKTQSAIEYSYRYRDRYQYILWIHADSRDRLGKDVMALATKLSLLERIETYTGAIRAFKQWLETTRGWLLILDHVNDLSLVRSCIPQRVKGHILLTTCTQITGDVAYSIAVEGLTVEEGANFLLKRAKVIDLTSQTIEREAAENICRMMEGLPLALEQVGAYIEETMCSLKHYSNLYLDKPAKLLKRRGGVQPYYTLAVADAWLQCFAKVEQTNSDAAELLKFCTFLDPHAMPEEIIIAGGAVLGPTFLKAATDLVALDETVRELRRYSLIYRDPSTMILSIHPLMRVILQERMDDDERRKWAERAVRAVKQVFPDGRLPERDRCQRYVAQVKMCVKHISRWEMGFAEAIELIKIEEQMLSMLEQPGGE